MGGLVVFPNSNAFIGKSKLVISCRKLVYHEVEVVLIAGRVHYTVIRIESIGTTVHGGIKNL